MISQLFRPPKSSMEGVSLRESHPICVPRPVRLSEINESGSPARRPSILREILRSATPAYDVQYLKYGKSPAIAAVKQVILLRLRNQRFQRDDMRRPTHRSACAQSLDMP